VSIPFFFQRNTDLSLFFLFGSGFSFSPRAAKSHTELRIFGMVPSNTRFFPLKLMPLFFSLFGCERYRESLCCVGRTGWPDRPLLFTLASRLLCLRTTSPFQPCFYTWALNAVSLSLTRRRPSSTVARLLAPFPGGCSFNDLDPFYLIDTDYEDPYSLYPVIVSHLVFSSRPALC